MLCLLHSDLLFTLRQKKHLERVREPPNLQFSVESALVATHTVHDAGDVVEAVLHVLQHRKHFFVLSVLEEHAFSERVIAAAVLHQGVELLQQLLNSLVFCVLRRINLLLKCGFHNVHCLESGCVNQVKVLDTVLVTANSAVEVGFVRDKLVGLGVLETD